MVRLSLRTKVGVFLGGAALATSGLVWGMEIPVAVSPGGADTGAVVEARCPTFSWSEVDGAESYELLVYRVGDEGEEEEPVLRQRFTGAVESWTPSLDRCFERGGQYAWSVRAESGHDASGWSAPSLFEVAPGPSEVELLEAALRLVQELGGRPEGADSGAGPGAGALPVAASPTPQTAPEPTPRSHTGSGSSIIVDGVPVETKAGPPCYPAEGDADEADRFIDCGNGTVLDTVTGLLWLQWANCRSCIPPVVPCPVQDGERDWYEANEFASNLRDGVCNLSDHSQRGDWRLPSKSEWNEIVEQGCEESPRIAGKAGGCYSDGPWALELVSFGDYWSSSSYAPSPNVAWKASVSIGVLDGILKESSAFFWPVRGGR